MKVLALGAHPDDVEIFAFGSLMAWRAMGAQVASAVATDGAAGGAGDPEALRHTRRAEATSAAKLLRADPHFLDQPDGGLVAGGSLIGLLRSLVCDVGPDIVVTHAPNDYHADHRALSAAVSQAVNFGAPVLWMDTLNGTGFVPTHYVDVSEHFPAKCAAIRCHASQDPERFVHSATRQADFRAGECNGGLDARAEAFRFEPRFPFADIRALLPPAPAVCPVVSRARDPKGGPTAQH